jgi:hypothetical protein
MAHYCRICDQYRANEKFSGKGHATHVCKDCMKLPKSERQNIEGKEEISRFLNQSNISENNLARLQRLTTSSDEEVARIAKLVLEIGNHIRTKRDVSSF